MMNELPPEDLRPTKRSTIASFGPLGVARILINLFSTVDHQRCPPSDNKTKHVRLITIGVSHFCEKARWGLDILEADTQDSPVYYTEDAHPPPFLSFATLAASNDKASASPMIVQDTVVLYKSDEILFRTCDFLYPVEIQNEIVNLELDLGKRLGATVRCVAYHSLLQPDHHPACIKMGTVGTSKVEALLFEKMLDKGAGKAMRELLVVNESTANASEVEIRRVFQDLSQRLDETGGAYLMDTKAKTYGFTAADLTFAALAYPIIRPLVMMDLCVPNDQVPPTLLKLGDDLRETTAGKHVLNMYRLHRPVQNDGLVHIKTAQRDRNPFKEGLAYSILGVGILGAATGVLILAWRRNK